MEEKIKLYYNLDVIKVNNLYYCDGVYYIYEEYKGDISGVDSWINILKNKKIRYTEPIVNVNGQYISEGYILLKLNYFLDDELKLQDVIKYGNDITFEMNAVDWLEKWKKKVDYIEYQIKELAIDKKMIQSSFNYYIGLAENAISLMSNLEEKNCTISLSRYRIAYPLLYNDFFNPTYFLKDTKVRDIAGFLKAKFFRIGNIDEDLEVVFKCQLTKTEFNLFFIRMLYPSYYFDAVENVLLKNESENVIKDIVIKVDDYEKILKKIAKKLSYYSDLKIPHWLI